MPSDSEIIDPFLHFVIPLNEAGFRYIITGSVASMMYGEPRMTNDVDLVLFLPETEAVTIERLFPLDDFYCPPEDVLKIEASRDSDGHFNLIHHKSGFKADVYLVGRDTFLSWAVDQARFFEFAGHQVPLAPPEYVIVKKLEYYRDGGSEKHLRDIRAMLKISGEHIDFPLLHEKLQNKGLAELWTEVEK